MTSPRQTLTYLRDLFEARGLQPKSKLGQSFLIDLNLLDFLVRVGELGKSDAVLEVGTGTGSLTTRLAEEAHSVLGVELDAGFYALARDNTSTLDNVTLIHADVLKNKNRLNPDVLEAVKKLRKPSGVSRLKLIANLPYAVATPVIGNFLIEGTPFERMVVTIQMELAERLVAVPSTKDYGALSVLVQSVADVRLVRGLSPSAFWPRPKVRSAIVIIRPDAELRAKVGDVQGFRDFLRELYIHRRKNLRGALWPFMKERFDKESLDRHLKEQEFDPHGRAEALSVAEHLRLWKCGLCEMGRGE